MWLGNPLWPFLRDGHLLHFYLRRGPRHNRAIQQPRGGRGGGGQWRRTEVGCAEAAQASSALVVERDSAQRPPAGRRTLRRVRMFRACLISYLESDEGGNRALSQALGPAAYCEEHKARLHRWASVGQAPERVREQIASGHFFVSCFAEHTSLPHFEHLIDFPLLSWVIPCTPRTPRPGATSTASRLYVGAHSRVRAARGHRRVVRLRR